MTWPGMERGGDDSDGPSKRKWYLKDILVK